MGLVFYCQGVDLPRLSLESCEEDKKLRRLGESRLRWNSLIREVTPAFNGELFWEKVKLLLLLHASTPIGNSPLPNNNHQTTTGLGCPLPRRLSTL